MSPIVYFTLFVIISIVCILADLPAEDNVLVLGDSNFDEAATTHSQLLVEFYAPWCGHCKQLAPEWSKAAGSLAASSSVKLAKVDVTENEALGKQFDIKGFPTIKYFKNGKPSDYNGGRTASEIVTWVSKKSGPPATTLTSDDELLKFQESHDAFALGVFSDSDSESAKAFLFIASNDEINTYAFTTSATIKNKLKIDKDTVVVLKSFDEGRVDHVVGDSKLVIEDVMDFVVSNSIPLVQEFSPDSAKKIFGSPIQKHVLFFTDKAASYHADTVATFKGVASSYKGQLLFINVPSTEQKILDYFGITLSQLPTAVFADLGAPSGIKKFPYTGAIEAVEVASFADKFLTGSLTPSLKSEDVSPEDTAGNVVILKGTSFNDLVINNDKDVLVEFYAPWCGHCKKLAPIWDELGDKMAESNSNIVIAKMDSTANEVDVEGLAVKGFPTIYFFKGNDKKNPIKYEEGRELDDFVNYLNKNAYHFSSHEEL